MRIEAGRSAVRCGALASRGGRGPWDLFPWAYEDRCAQFVSFFPLLPFWLFMFVQVCAGRPLFCFAKLVRLVSMSCVATQYARVSVNRWRRLTGERKPRSRRLKYSPYLYTLLRLLWDYRFASYINALPLLNTLGECRDSYDAPFAV